MMIKITAISMSKNLFRKYVWLAETIYNAKKITLSEINRKWLDSDFSEGNEIPRRTFHTWKNEVEDIFGIIIECDKRDGDQYYIGNREVLECDSLQRWLLDTVSVSNMLMENKSLNNRILLENIPSGRDYLATVLEAMKKNKLLEISYKGFGKQSESTFPVAPYCVKLFRQRWYLVCNSFNGDTPRIYSLDRVRDVKLTDEPFKYPDNFCPEDYFYGFFGIIHDEDYEVETVVLRANAMQANYLRSLPLHPSQKEMGCIDNYTIFTLQVRPTFDFQQELLWNGDALEVQEPLWLRKEMAERTQRMCDIYKNKRK